MLSGSGLYLYCHVGVVKALWEEGLLQSIISGSSGGSVIGAMVCTHMSISVAPAEKHQNSKLLNAVTSPSVLIREVAKASGAVPGIFAPVTFAARNRAGKKVPYHGSRSWVDGTITDDLPTKRLARLYGVNHYLVSQANPLIVPLSSANKGASTAKSIVRSAAVTLGKAWINAAAALTQRPIGHLPFLNSAASIFISVLNQNFTGGINIFRPKYKMSIRKILSSFPPVGDISALMALGERSTWPKTEMIRT